MPGLDGLRAVAVLAVIAYHLNWGWAPGGLLGVGVFFVLSGYLITDLLLAQRERYGHIAFGRFWRRRARRLLPALWVMLGAVVLWVALAQPLQLSMLRTDVLAALFYFSNWWYALQHVAYFASFGPPSPLGHLWSLAVEEQFYLFWPLLLGISVYLFGRRQRSGRSLIMQMRAGLGVHPTVPVALVIIAAIASATAMALLWRPGADPDRVYYGTDTRAFELLLGAALAFVWPSTRPAALDGQKRAALEMAGVAGLIVIAVLIVVTNEYDAFLYRGGFALLALATVAVIAALSHPATWFGRALGFKPLRWLGVRSYGIYLWHYPVIVLTTPLVDTAGAHLLRSLFQIGGTIAIAALSWRYVEQPVREHGFSVLLTPVRASYWSWAAQPNAVYNAAVASALLIGAFGAGFVGLTLPGTAGTQPSQQLTASATTQDDSDAGQCVEPAPLPIPLPPPPPVPPPSGADVTAIGDSIMIDLASSLANALPGITVDGVVSRQMNQLQDVLGTMRAEGRLGHQLVIELGTNGPFDESQLVSTLRSLGPMQRIVLVNAREPRPWESDVNQALADAAHQVDHTTVVDWHGASAGHPEYFFDDGVHPNATGASVLSGLIAHALAPTPPAPPPRNPSTIHVMRCAWW
jgi:peptidoglycan/LPS O-acetylase OafA/YrhL